MTGAGALALGIGHADRAGRGAVDRVVVDEQGVGDRAAVADLVDVGRLGDGQDARVVDDVDALDVAQVLVQVVTVVVGAVGRGLVGDRVLFGVAVEGRHGVRAAVGPRLAVVELSVLVGVADDEVVAEGGRAVVVDDRGRGAGALGIGHADRAGAAAPSTES